MLIRKHNTLKDEAFTVVEVAIIIPIVMIAIGIFTLTFLNFSEKGTVLRSDSFAVTEVQNALSRVAGDVADAQKFMAMNGFDLQSPQGSNNGTTKFTNYNAENGTNQTLILKMPFTKTNPRTASTSTDNYVYIPNSPLSCNTPGIQENDISTHEVVYFNNNGLRRRTLVPANYSSSTNVCSAPWQKPTCEAGVSGSYCSGGKDEAVLADSTNEISFENWSIAYYERNTPIPITESHQMATTATRQKTLDKATSVKVTVEASYKDESGKTMKYKAERILPLD